VLFGPAVHFAHVCLRALSAVTGANKFVLRALIDLSFDWLRKISSFSFVGAHPEQLYVCAARARFVFPSTPGDS
jgi:hypothetical protein